MGRAGRARAIADFSLGRDRRADRRGLPLGARDHDRLDMSVGVMYRTWRTEPRYRRPVNKTIFLLWGDDLPTACTTRPARAAGRGRRTPAPGQRRRRARRRGDADRALRRAGRRDRQRVGRRRRRGRRRAAHRRPRGARLRASTSAAGSTRPRPGTAAAPTRWPTSRCCAAPPSSTARSGCGSGWSTTPPIAIRTQATFGYVQNIVLEPVTADAPRIDAHRRGAVPERRRSPTCTRSTAAAATTPSWAAGSTELMASVARFGADHDLDLVPTSRYLYEAQVGPSSRR